MATSTDEARRISAAVLAGSLGTFFAYTSFHLFLSNQRSYLRNFQKFLTTKQNCRVVSQPSPTNENKLVYICDNVQPNDTVHDDLFQFEPTSIEGTVIYIYRECETYQWSQSTSNLDSQYSKIWSSTLIDSGAFEDMEGHQNPASIIPSKLFHTKDFTVSNFAFNLSENERITEPNMPIRLLLKYAKLLKHEAIRYNELTANTEPDHSQHGWYYFSNSEKTNESDERCHIGDIRVRFWIITQPLSLTVIGKQNGSKISIDKQHIGRRCIGKYSLNQALRRFCHLKLVSNETGSVFVMSNLALSCCIYATELLKPVIWRQWNKENASDTKVIQSTQLDLNGIGLRAFIGSAAICGPVYCLSVLYPRIEGFYAEHSMLMNSIAVLSVASLVVGGSKRFS